MNTQENNTQKSSEVICLLCYNRWTATRSEDVHLKQIECPVCHRYGYVIETGDKTTV